VGKAVMAETHKHKRGLLVGCDAHAGNETSVGTLQDIDETIEKPCSDLLAFHQRKCEYTWPAWPNGDVSHLETCDEITTHGEYI
jgi:hypothetical protein